MAYHNRTQHIGNVTATPELRKTATLTKRAPRMPDTFEIHEPTTEEQAEALKQFFAATGAAKKRREDASAQLAPALEKITEALTDHWSTGSGRRLRQIVWSIYNGRTLVILGDVLTNFDGELGEAVATLIHAKLCGVDMDDLLREILKRSGEFARYEEAERETPEDEGVIYPPLPLSAESLHRLARSATRQEARTRKSVAWRRGVTKTEHECSPRRSRPTWTTSPNWSAFAGRSGRLSRFTRDIPPLARHARRSNHASPRTVDFYVDLVLVA